MRRTRTVVVRLFQTEDLERVTAGYKAIPDIARQCDEQIRQERAAERARQAEQQSPQAAMARAAEEEGQRDHL